jgi:hypothetical protein
MPAGGRGYTRPPTLISLWSTAPFLLNNSVGPFDQDPSVEARLRSFDASIEQMLWPEKRDKDLLLGDRIPGRIDRTTQATYLRVSSGYLPDFLRKLPLRQLLPNVNGSEGLEVGPIPSGTPVNLLASLRVLSEDQGPVAVAQYQGKVAALGARVIKDLAGLPKGATEEQARNAFRNLVDPLLELNKCPDFIVNRGHLFGTTLPDQDKRSLISYLKTF